tara:strand:+ start:386 stop:661 length:276 start_codon:yes stop_codon:yes gene_type:complete
MTNATQIKKELLENLMKTEITYRLEYRIPMTDMVEIKFLALTSAVHAANELIETVDVGVVIWKQFPCGKIEVAADNILDPMTGKNRGWVIN